MPRSKTRKHHHEQQRPASVEKAGKNRSAVAVAVFFLALIGVGIAYFASDGSIIWLVLGLVLGAGAGYYFGKQFDKSFRKQ